MRDLASTVVVVQSDQLSVWAGLAGVVLGAVITAGLEWWRSRRAGRSERRQALLRAGSDAAAAAAAYQRAATAAGADRGNPAWHEVIESHLETLHTATLTINVAGGGEAVETASLQLIQVAMKAIPENDPQAFQQQMAEQSAAVTAYRDAVKRAKL